MAAPSITYDNVIELLFRAFPILQSIEYCRLTSGCDELGPYVIFGVTFNQFIEDNVIANHEGGRERVGAFVEGMLSTKDAAVNILAEREILPTFLRSQRRIDTYWPYLGSMTQRKLILLGPKLAPRIQIP